MSKRPLQQEEEEEGSSEAEVDSSSEEEVLPEDYSSDDDSDGSGGGETDDSDSQSDGASDEDDEHDDSSDGDDDGEDTGIGLSSEEDGNNNNDNDHDAVVAKEKPSTSNEYEQDSSDEEDIRNTVGNIPLEWYKDLEHLGYDVHGEKVVKPAQGDTIDEFVAKMEDPDYWRTVTNKWTGQKTVLSEDDVKLLKNLQKGVGPSTSQEDMYPEWIDFFSGEEMIHPVTNRPMDKRSFIPSKWEKLKVGQMVHSIKMGWMKPRKERKEEDEEEGLQQKCYDLWADTAEDNILRRYRQHIPAPKMSLPHHSESINPPPEYLFTKEEEEKWKEQEPEERRMNYMPKKFSSLRLVPAYNNFISERFERCLDLYLCARQRKMKMNVNPQDLLPKMPKPKDLQPFPTTQALVYKGHTDIIRSICPDPSGQWLVSGSDDGTVRFWEVSSGRCLKTVDVGGRVSSVSWNPNPTVCLVAVAVNTTVLILSPGFADKLIVAHTENLLSTQNVTAEAKDQPVDWVASDLNVQDYKSGVRLRLEHPMEVTQVTWHGKGDYFASVMPKGDRLAVLIHLLSKRHSQSPFSKSKGLVQCVRFHPVRPVLFVATQRFVRVYNLVKQQLMKKLTTNCKWVSSMAVHPAGDNVLVGSYDCRSSWFDLDLSTKPYQTLKHHKRAVRQVAYHRSYPLFATASDDGSVIVCHGKVFSDLLQNPLIVPVKVLRGHTVTQKLGVMDCRFHPTQPWVFSAGADATIRLFS